MVKLILYSAVECQLCDEARKVIDSVLALPAFDGVPVNLETVDVTATTELLKQYGKKIPVIKTFTASGGEKELPWPFTKNEFIEWWIRAL